jgi:hypothetical protein
MKKIIEKDCYTIEIETVKKTNGVSCVASVKTFVKPKTSSKANWDVINALEDRVHTICNIFTEKSDLMSDNHIVDFDCTRENLNPEKWSRMKVDLYLFTPFVECEDELASEAITLCEKIGRGIKSRMDVSRFEMARIAL